MNYNMTDESLKNYVFVSDCSGCMYFDPQQNSDDFDFDCPCPQKIIHKTKRVNIRCDRYCTDPRINKVQKSDNLQKEAWRIIDCFSEDSNIRAYEKGENIGYQKAQKHAQEVIRMMAAEIAVYRYPFQHITYDDDRIKEIMTGYMDAFWGEEE